MSDTHQITPLQQGGFHSPEREWPGLTDEMQPRPDHGEHSYEGHQRLGVTGGRATF